MYHTTGITDFKQKLVGLGADGTNVNSGDKNGVQAVLKQEMAWLVFIWCMGHRLELSIKDALKGTYFKMVDEMLLRIYYLYEKSPKKLRELKEIHELIKETFEFADDSVRPIRASGTRWIAHKLNAIQRILDKYGIYISHLENSITEDKAYKADQRAKMKGYIKEWKSSKMLFNLAFYCDILNPLKKVSLVFQKEGVDVVEVTNAISKAKRDFARLTKRRVNDFPRIRDLLSKNENDDDDEDLMIYQNVNLKSFERELEQLEEKKVEELDAVQSNLEARLEEKNSEYLEAITQIINCQGWERYFLSLHKKKKRHSM